MKCPFCNLVPERNRVIYEGKTVFVMPSNPRLIVGHLLVVPYRHIERPSELTVEGRKELFDTVLEFQEKILTKLAKGCDIRENFRPFIKQSDTKVNHIHFHLIPRDLNDEIFQKYEKIQREVFKMMTKDEMEKIVKIFKIKPKKI